MREARCVESQILLRKEAMPMLLEQVYLLCIYILLLFLGMITIIAVGLFVALVVTVKKLDNIENTSLPGR